MLNLKSTGNVRSSDSLSRRDFLRVGALAAGSATLSLTDLAWLDARSAPSRTRSCIMLFLVGGPSQLDTWDLKPNAPDTIRGPFRPIRTNVPGIDICEHFPRMARMADRYAIIRSVHHKAVPIHETGCQLLQTGGLSRPNHVLPHVGSVLSSLRSQGKDGRLEKFGKPGDNVELPSFVVLPGPIHNTGVSVGHGQTAGFLGGEHDPVCLSHEALDRILPEQAGLQRQYGRNAFGRSCLRARQLVERGVGLVTVNMFDTVFNTITWDCHAEGGALPATLDDYKELLCPMFDRAWSALLDDLHQRGLLESTLVVAMGEFGRTPQLNPRGGRDHWPSCWSILCAGGGTRGGQVIGASDAIGAEPKDRPVTPPEIVASIYHALGEDGRTKVQGPDGRQMRITDAKPVRELFGS